MQTSNIPAKFPIPFAGAAGAGFIETIPVASQIGITDGAASLTDGFPPDNFQAVAAGGVPPFGQAFNGILKQITSWNQWQQAGGPIAWDSTFSTNISGYPKGALVHGTASGSFFYSNTENNTTNPNSGGAGWVTLSSLILASPAITGNGTAVTQTVNSSNTTLANTFYADRAATNAANAVLATAEAYTLAQLAFYLPLIGGTLSGPLAIVTASGNANFFIDGVAGTTRQTIYRTAGSTRWAEGVNATAESGANAGSNWFKNALDDSGNLLGGVYTINRATQVLALLQSPTVPTAGAVDGSTKAANTFYVDRGDASTLSAAEAFAAALQGNFENFQTFIVGTVFTSANFGQGMVYGQTASAAGTFTYAVPTNGAVQVPANNSTFNLHVAVTGAGNVFWGWLGAAGFVPLTSAVSQFILPPGHVAVMSGTNGGSWFVYFNSSSFDVAGSAAAVETAVQTFGAIGSSLIFGSTTVWVTNTTYPGSTFTGVGVSGTWRCMNSSGPLNQGSGNTPIFTGLFVRIA